MSLNAETSSIYLALGLRENHRLPDEGISARHADILRYNGRVSHIWNVRLLAKAEANGRVQRVQAQCPNCRKWFAAGNLNQHLHGYRTCKGKVEGCTEA